MAFKALRPFKYQSEPGGPMKIAKVGQEFPEAVQWKSLESLIRRRWLTQENGESWSGRQYGIFRGQQVLAPATAPSRAPEKTQPVLEKSPPSTPVEVASYSQEILKRLPKSDVVAIAYSMDLDAEGYKSEVIDRILAKESD